jgi:hypothetical protein
MKKIFIILFLILAAAIARAEMLYQIDLIVFKQITQDVLNSESWIPEFKYPSFKISASRLWQPELLPPEGNTALQSIEDQLKSNHYEILLKQSWIQAVTSPQSAKIIKLKGGVIYDTQGQIIERITEKAPELTEKIENSIDLSNNPVSYFDELTGMIKISKQNFFDIDLRLYLQVPTSITRPPEMIFYQGQPIALQTFTLMEKRRTPKNQLNYLDHPLFGALIKITKL